MPEVKRTFRDKVNDREKNAMQRSRVLGSKEAWKGLLDYRAMILNIGLSLIT